MPPRNCRYKEQYTRKLRVVKYVKRQTVKHCHKCQLAKVNKFTVTPLASFIPPEDRFQPINIDLVGPLPLCQEYQYLLTMIDRHTRRPEAVPLKDISGETVAKAITSTWIASFGTPKTITTNQDRKFESHRFSISTEPNYHLQSSSQRDDREMASQTESIVKNSLARNKDNSTRRYNMLTR